MALESVFFRPTSSYSAELIQRCQAAVSSKEQDNLFTSVNIHVFRPRHHFPSSKIDQRGASKVQQVKTSAAKSATLSSIPDSEW